MALVSLSMKTSKVFPPGERFSRCNSHDVVDAELHRTAASRSVRNKVQQRYQRRERSPGGRSRDPHGTGTDDSHRPPYVVQVKCTASRVVPVNKTRFVIQFVIHLSYHTRVKS